MSVKRSNGPTMGLWRQIGCRTPTPTAYIVSPLHDSRGHVIGTMCAFYDKNDESRSDGPHLPSLCIQPGRNTTGPKSPPSLLSLSNAICRSS